MQDDKRLVRVLETTVIRHNNRSTMLHTGKVYPYEKAMDHMLALKHAEFVDEKKGKKSLAVSDAMVPAPEPAPEPEKLQRAVPLQKSDRDGGLSE